MISFSKIVKEEIVFNDFDIVSSKAILCAIIKMNGSLSLGHSGLSLTLRTENAKIAKKVHAMLKELYQPQIEFRVSRKMKLNKNNVYILMISKGREILEDLGIMQGFGFSVCPDKKILCSDTAKRAYLAGMFLSSGSVNNPITSNYHLEMSVIEEELASFICDLMNEHELNAKVIKRRNKYVIYMKSVEKIIDFLRAIGASTSVMDYEMERISRNMNSTINRVNNCDLANETKAMSACMSQMDDIAFIMDKAGLEILDDKTRSVALIRLENPELRLNELAEVYYEKTGKTISKSGLHHRFKKIKDEALKLRQMEND